MRYQAGQQVYLDYGRKPNHVLLPQYGFVVPNNVDDRIEIRYAFTPLPPPPPPPPPPRVGAGKKTKGGENNGGRSRRLALQQSIFDPDAPSTAGASLRPTAGGGNVEEGDAEAEEDQRVVGNREEGNGEDGKEIDGQGVYGKDGDGGGGTAPSSAHVDQALKQRIAAAMDLDEVLHLEGAGFRTSSLAAMRLLHMSREEFTAHGVARVLDSVAGVAAGGTEDVVSMRNEVEVAVALHGACRQVLRGYDDEESIYYSV